MLDYKKDLKQLYAPSAKEPVLLEVPVMNFLMVDGAGDPVKVAEYKSAVEALYSVSYNLKFRLKKEGLLDYSVFPLEGLWWAEVGEKFKIGERDDWKWTMLIMQPEQVTAEHVQAAISEVAKKKDLVALPKVRFETFDEGWAAQILHIGPYATELPTVEKLDSFIAQNGYERTAKHHEIYLSDPNRCAPEKLKTIIRHPVTK